MSGERVTVNAEDIYIIVAAWRNANEAPGGCSSREAINAMGDAVFRLELEHRAQLGRPSC